ncbi:hypothetical protein [Candidatus Binatus soli]|jgi:hypothetical protein|uniref:hypothetical protein n=1 Tax=Candidatus Binatus soli TaxID=1953413 RepID=UPI003D10D705
MDDGREPKELVGLAGEYAAASELCRRGLYAQLTLGNRKKVDLLVAYPNGKYAAVEVKAKQTQVWPGVKGLSPKEKNRFLVFVDIQRKSPTERPDFYVLNCEDWGKWVQKKLADPLGRGKVTIDEDNVPYWKGKGGKGDYYGTSVSAEEVKDFAERWEKITG